MAAGGASSAQVLLEQRREGRSEADDMENGIRFSERQIFSC